MPPKPRSKSKPKPKSAPSSSSTATSPPSQPTDINPYTVLSLPPTCTAPEIKRAYRALALTHHPDKATGPHAATAHTDFQRIAFAYSILSDPARRARYDATGSTSASALDDEDGDFDWADFFAARYQEVTEDKLAAFVGSYKGSEEERGDVLRAYVAGRGSMDRVYEGVMASNVLEDDGRFRGIIGAAIESGEVEGFKRFVEESEKSRERRVKRARREAEEAEEAREEMEEKRKGKGRGKAGGKGEDAAGGMGDLVAMIQGRQKERGKGFLEQLEAKALAEEEERGAKKGRGGRKRKAVEEDEDGDEPPEEAFKAMEERMKKAKKGKK